MLTAAQIGALQDKFGQLLDPVIEFLIEDIARRVSEAGQLTGTAAYQTWQAQKLGLSQKKLKEEIAKRLEKSTAEVERLMKQAAKTGYNFDLSRLPTHRAIPFAANSNVQQILDAAVKLAKEDLTNITQTIGFVGSDGVCRELTAAYNQACDVAHMKVATGAQDYISAVREATRNLAAKGIRTIDYESGVHTSLEAAVRRNMMGGLGLMQEQISQSNHDDLGCDGWEISAHAGSAPDHEPIQGKQYTDAEFQRINNSLVRRIGTLNCGHAAFPIILGVNGPQYTEEELEEFRQQNETGVTIDGRHYTIYEATQRQRKFERAIRGQKHKILIDKELGNDAQLQTDQIKLQRLKQEYSRFSKAADLPLQYERMEAAGFTWKDGKAAEKTAKTAKRAETKIPRIQKAKTGKNGKNQRSIPVTLSAEGGSPATWDEKRGTISWTTNRRKSLFTTEQSSVLSPVEIGTLYTADGKSVFRLEGDAGNVNFTVTQIKQMRNGILTHNHPGADYGCFSPEDINMLRRAHLDEIRCATPIGVFSIQSPTTWPSEINDFDKIEGVYYDIYEHIGKDYYAKAMRGEISVLDAENLSQRVAVEELCKRYKIPFKFETWDDLAKG